MVCAVELMENEAYADAQDTLQAQFGDEGWPSGGLSRDGLAGLRWRAC